MPGVLIQNTPQKIQCIEGVVDHSHGGKAVCFYCFFTQSNTGKAGSGFELGKEYHEPQMDVSQISDGFWPDLQVSARKGCPRVFVRYILRHLEPIAFNGSNGKYGRADGRFIRQIQLYLGVACRFFDFFSFVIYHPFISSAPLYICKWTIPHTRRSIHFQNARPS